MDEIIVLCRWLLRPRRALLVLALVAALLLLSALGFQYLGGLQPCPLCLWQRWAHLAGLLLALIGWLVTRHGQSVRLWLLPPSLAIAAGAGIALFHMGVEQQWWQFSCGGLSGMDSADTLNDLKESLLAAPMVRCDGVAWRLIGLSMAGWNFVISLMLAGYGLLAAWVGGHQSPSRFPTPSAGN
ncbi:MAG: disulfide bond formation protein B [Alphaproteobacteria bacterium]|nr:disulfide bond formation protein B [Alphaproteobacteria bacterium]